MAGGSVTDALLLVRPLRLPLLIRRPTAALSAPTASLREQFFSASSITPTCSNYAPT